MPNTPVFEKHEEMSEAVADLLSNENVIGWMQGRMEFGPRALATEVFLAILRSRGNAEKIEP